MIPVEFHKWIVMIVVAILVILLFYERIKPSVSFFGAVIFLVAIKVVPTEDLMKNIANQQIATIMLLIVITDFLSKAYNLEGIFDRIFKSASPKSFLIQMTSSVAVVSAVVHNTPIVALLTPYIYDWCRKMSVPPSKMLIPLSFATILGGMMTVLGTSTNLVLNGFITQSGGQALGLLDFLLPGLLVTIVGIAYLYFYGYNILPSNKTFDDVKVIAPEYLVETIIRGGSKLIGTTIGTSEIQHYNGVYLIEIHRGNRVITPVAMDEQFQENDKLLFMGKTDNIMQMVNSNLGLQLPRHDESREIIEAIVPANSALSGKTVQEINFPESYEAELVAIHRNGEKLNGTLEDKKLLDGDLLLLSISDTFNKISEKVNDFYVISRLPKHKPTNPLKLKLGLVGMFVIIGLCIAFSLNLFESCLMLFGFVIVMNFVKFKTVAKEFDADLYVLLASALTMGNVLIKSGAAEMISKGFVGLFYPFGHVGIMIGLFVITVIITNFITNVAAVSMTFPMAFSVGQELGIDPTGLYVAICFAASCSFITPVGYQTNLMVYGPGSYKAKDFFKIGTPLTIIYSIVTIIFIALYYKF